MSALSERIKLLMASGVTVTEMANIADVKPPSVSDWINGKTKSLKAGPALRISKHFDVNQLWLTEGVGLSGLKPTRVDANPALLPSNIAVIKPATERDKAIERLLDLATQLDLARIGQLTERAAMLLAEMPAKQTLPSSQ